MKLHIRGQSLDAFKLAIFPATLNELYDAYQVLLTSKQKTYLELYYQEDLSLSEIAEQFEVSRNAVFDNIKRTEKLLEDYETKLQLLKKREIREEILDQMQVHTQDEQMMKWINELQQLDLEV